MKCEACGFDNPPDALFCTRCTAPVSVVALGELDEADGRRCLSALLSVTAEAVARNDVEPVDSALWEAYLSAFWLRPETAAVLYAEAQAVHRATRGLDRPEWLDLGCGDGVHAALTAGWRFESVFDVFQAVDLSARDIYHAWDPSRFSAPVARAGRGVAWGVDIKDTAVARAGALGVFQNVRQADATKLPLPDASVDVIFSNMLRDLGEPLPAALGECHRVLRPGGRLLISAMTPAYARKLYFAPAAREALERGDDSAARRLLRLDRGRSVFCQRQLSVEGWERILREASLRVAGVEPIAGEELIRFWDVGLRPFSIDLLRQRQRWQEKQILSEVKPAFVRMLSHVLHPLVSRAQSGETCMQLLIVEKE